MVQIKGDITKLVQVKDAIILGFHEDDLKLSAEVKALDKKYANVISTAIKEKKFKGSDGQCVPLYLNKIILLGFGKKKTELRKKAATFGSAIKSIRSLDPKKVALYSESIQTKDYNDFIEKMTIALHLGLYQYNDYKTKDKDKIKKIDSIAILCQKNKQAAAKKAITQAAIIAESVSKTRNVVNTPPNVAVPEYMAKYARSLAKHPKVKLKVVDEKALKKLGMNCYVAVGQASVNPPRMVILEYKGGSKSQKPIVLIGKGITYDTGGINTKPSGSMATMKFDKAGACSVIHVLEACARLKLKINVVAIGSFAENAVAGNAYKPDDVFKSHSGITVEVIHSDAEGRMVLCDTLSYANKVYKPKQMINVATLTGAAIVATGYLVAPIMGTDQKLVDRLKEAGERSFDRVWQLPLWPEHDDILKSDIADVKHLTPEMDCGTIVAGAFLKQFTGKTPWAHIDIAGTGWSKGEKGYLSKGGTGSSVLLLIDYLRHLK